MKKTCLFLMALSLVALFIPSMAATAEAALPSVEELCDAKGVVIFNDPLVEKAVRDELELPEGDVTKKQMASMKSLTVDSSELTDVNLSVLQLCTKLDSLELYKVNATNWNALSACTALTELRIRGVHLINLDFVAPMSKLNQVIIGDQIDDVSALEQCKKLSMVDLTGISEESLMGLLDSRGKSLVTLAIKDCSLSNDALSAIGVLSIGTLRLDNITCDTVTPLYALKSLRVLRLNNMKIDTFEGIEGMKKLQSLGLQGIENVPSLEPLLKLKAFKGLNLKDCGEAEIPDGLKVRK